MNRKMFITNLKSKEFFHSMQVNIHIKRTFILVDTCYKHKNEVHNQNLLDLV